MEKMLLKKRSDTIDVPSKFQGSGKIIDGSQWFTRESNQTNEPSYENTTEENTIIAKDFPTKVEIPVYIEKGEKVTIRVYREKIGSTTISRTNFPSYKMKDSSEINSKVTSLSTSFAESPDAENVEQLKQEIKQLNDIIKLKGKEADDKMDRLQIRFKYFKFYSYIWGFSAVLVCILSSLWIFNILPAFPAISGLLAALGGIFGAYLDWKDREKKYD